MDDIQFQFSVIISPIQFLCGLFSSIISIIVFNKSELKNQSTKSYLIITCIINIVTVTYLPFAIIPAIWNINDLDCKIYIALSLLIAQIQPWVLALSSLDRLVFIVLPTRYLFRKKIIFQIGICTAALLLIVITITPCVYYYNALTDTNNQTLCSFPTDVNLKWVLNYFKIQFFLFRITIPCCIMIASNIIVLWKIYKRELRIILNPRSKTTMSLAKSLVGMDLIFILTKIPMLFYLLLTNNGPDKIIYNFTYSLFVIISLSYNYLYFLFLIILNKIYRVTFLKYVFFFKKPSAIAPIQ